MVRVVAMLSALCSLGYLVGLVVGIVMLFFHWKLALVILILAMILVPCAKAFDKAKMRGIYGPAGDMMADLDWASGKKEALDRDAIALALRQASLKQPPTTPDDQTDRESP